jgi:hypothetical protein
VPTRAANPVAEAETTQESATIAVTPNEEAGVTASMGIRVKPTIARPRSTAEDADFATIALLMAQETALRDSSIGNSLENSSVGTKYLRFLAHIQMFNYASPVPVRVSVRDSARKRFVV